MQKNMILNEDKNMVLNRIFDHESSQDISSNPFVSDKKTAFEIPHSDHQ